MGDMSSDEETHDHTCPGCGEHHAPIDIEKAVRFLGPEIPADAGPKLRTWEQRVKPLLEQILDICEQEQISFFAHTRCDVEDDPERDGASRVSGASTMYMREGDGPLGVMLAGTSTGQLVAVPREVLEIGTALQDMAQAALDGHGLEDDRGPDGALLN